MREPLHKGKCLGSTGKQILLPSTEPAFRQGKNQSERFTLNSNHELPPCRVKHAAENRESSKCATETKSPLYSEPGFQPSSRKTERK